MPTIEKRIEALERSNPVHSNGIVCLIRCVRPGHLDAEIETLHSQDRSQQWERRAGEAEHDFTERAKSEVKRNERFSAMLIGSSSS